ncbi:protein kinase [Azoarcus sp. L1K30]|uniref:serine/threonine-protein kinase n=1 Tax=Azoarcus sp. L1K30 TaxID=2820277 RepID=UPI001B8222EE|nr:serine/threonine-protein kinase [Azoarcus sp. L1K30]MBR0565115.1 protein kinase [Azoarcus sp. L1K30]
MNAPAPAENLTIARYVISHEIGRGAMGTVYRAVDPMIERKIALKVLSVELLSTDREDFRERFFREAKAAGRLNHPNIVTIHDVGESSEGVPYIAMEYLTGLSLRESLDSGMVLPLRKVVDIALLILRGLDYAHQHGIVHRDIKPANIMLARNGMVKIMDFGIALATDGSKSLDDAMAGSPIYMAPEQVSHGPVDARTDLFALGVTLYEMLTGKDPFAADSIPAVMHNILHHVPPPPSSLNPDVPPELDAVIMRTLAKPPADRFASARDLTRALTPIRRALRDSGAAAQTRTEQAPSVGSATIVATPGSRPMRAGTDHPATDDSDKSAARRPLLLVAVLVALSTAAVFAYFSSDTSEEGDRTLPVTPAVHAVPVSPAELASPPAPEAVASDSTEESTTAPSPAAPEARAPAIAAETQTVEPGALKLNVLPWGEIYVNGRKRGVTPPLRSLELPPGTYRIEIRNADFAPSTHKVTIKSGETISVRHRFQ